jgi:hypothetical protein
MSISAPQAVIQLDQAAVTLRVEGISKNVKTKDGLRYLHIGITPSGRQYGFFAEPLALGSFCTAFGGFGSLKKDKDGSDIVYLKHVTVTPREDILDDRVWTTMPPDGKILFYDVPDEHPWQD